MPNVLFGLLWVAICLGTLIYSYERPAFYYERQIYAMTVILSMITLLIQILLWCGGSLR